MGEVSILNVAAGDTKLTFDKSNPAECLRAGRIVKDMMRRGYALLVEVERGGVKKFERALDFDEAAGEYIIADFDQLTAHDHDMQEAAGKAMVQRRVDVSPAPKREEPSGESIEREEDVQAPVSESTGKGKRGRRRIDAHGTRAVSVGRSAGG